MPYGKQQDFDNPTLADFEQKATAQEKKLWDNFLKDYPQHFQRSVMADSNNFLFVCPSANLVVELEKFRRFSDSAGGVSGKKGDALREMGLKLAAYTNRELDTDFDGVCAAIDRMVQRQLSQESLVEIKKPVRLADDEDDTPTPGKGWKVTTSGEYKDDEPVGQYVRTDSVSTYGGNTAVDNPVKDGENVPTYGGNRPVPNPMKDGDEAYTYTRFNKRGADVGEVPMGNWQRSKIESDEPAEPVADNPKPAAVEQAGTIANDVAAAPRVSAAPAAPVHTGPKKIFIAKSADVMGEVRIGNDSSVWYQAVLRGDENPITIGERSNVQDGTIVHVAPGYSTAIGNGVTIGHNCTIHGCTIEDDVLIGMGSTILNGAVVGKGCIVGAGSLVTQNKRIPEGMLVLGSPAKAVRPLTEEERQSILNNAQEYVDLMDEEPGMDYTENADGCIVIK